MLHAELDIKGIVAAVAKANGRLAVNIPHALSLCADLVAVESKTTHEYTDRSGVLTNSIMADEVMGSFGADLSVAVGAGAPYGTSIEFGAKPHKIKPKFRKALRWPVEGGFAFAGEVNHPGNRAYSFLSNALQKQLPEIGGVMEDATILSFAQAGFGVE